MIPACVMTGAMSLIQPNLYYSTRHIMATTVYALRTCLISPALSVSGALKKYL